MLCSDGCAECSGVCCVVLGVLSAVVCVVVCAGCAECSGVCCVVMGVLSAVVCAV